MSILIGYRQSMGLDLGRLNFAWYLFSVFVAQKGDVWNADSYPKKLSELGWVFYTAATSIVVNVGFANVGVAAAIVAVSIVATIRCAGSRLSQSPRDRAH